LNDTRSANVEQSANQLALGTALVLAGQMAFVLSGYVLHFYLARAIDPITYGTYGLIMNVLTWTESVLNSGVPWAVRKFLPADPLASKAILRAGLRWQVLVGLMVFTVTMLAAPWFAGSVRDSGITLHLRLALTDILLMALYTLYRAALNGLRLFAAQGASMAVYSISKLGSSLILVGLGLSISGAIVGNVIGTLAGWLAALWLLQRTTRFSVRDAVESEAGQDKYDGRTMLGFALPTVLFTLASYFLTTIGLVGVKALVQDGRQVAFYSAANYLATAPSVLLVAFAFTLFPHLAGSIAVQDWPLTRVYIRSAVRYWALVLIPGVFLVLGTTQQIITLLYPLSYAAAAPLLNLLLVSTGLHSLYMVFANAILAEGRVLLALSISGALVPGSLALTWYLTERWGPSGAATAAVLTTGLAVVASGAYVRQRFAVRLPWASLGRMVVAATPMLAATRLYTAHGLALFPYYLALGVAYLLLLVLLREITPQEISQWRAGLSSTVQRWKIGARA
jgi:O-antigen/teichoic acid export membrane protein